MGRESEFILAVMIAASVYLACDALERYPDPLDPNKYYVRYSNNTFSHLTCPNGLTYEALVQLCVQKNTSCTPLLPILRGLTASQCGCDTGFYCNSRNTFTYCTYDGIQIENNLTCPPGKFCYTTNPNPCY